VRSLATHLASQSSTLAHDLAIRAHRHGERLAVAFTGGDNEWSRLSYAELAGRAFALADLLRFVRRGRSRQFVLIMLPNGPDYVVSVYGCLAAGAVAVPFYPPTLLTNRTTRVFRQRLGQIWQDCQPDVVILPRQLIDLVRAEPVGADTVLLAAEDLPEALAGPAVAADRVDARPGDLALLQYTSGSTIQPKGVMVTHANLAHNVRILAAALGSADGESLVSWLPMYHDMGLIGTVLHPLAAGMSLHQTTPAAFARKPFLWLDMLSRSRAAITFAPNFAYDLSVRWVPEEQRAGLDLSHLRVAVNAAEPVRHTTIETFIKAYQRHGFASNAMLPGYGLAEATLFVTVDQQRREPTFLEVSTRRLREHGVAAPADREPATVLTGCGTDAPDTSTVIVDPERFTPCPDGTVGEIWVTGPGVAGGYWNQPELSGQVFAAELPYDGRQFLRTGDLGTKVDGVLYIVGRIKDLIIQHGVNHYPQELEFTAESAHPAIRIGGVVVFAVAEQDAERVVALCELDSYSDRSESRAIRTAVRSAIVGHHGLDLDTVALVRKGQIPKTTSGKVRRRASAERWSAGEFALVDAPS
jgi:acyl-CoA synthetase (AMP-forming)/AMP-acid ligase II